MKISTLQLLLSAVVASGVVGVPAHATGEDSAGAHAGFIYGRVTTTDKTTFEGRLRWGGDEEALWSNYFNGVKDRNPWADSVPAEQLTRVRPIELFGIEFGSRRSRIDLERPLMVRFGDISRIEAKGRDLSVTLKSGRVIELDRFEADDFADGLQIRDTEGGLVELGEWPIQSVAFQPTPPLNNPPIPLQGTVYTELGAFTGLVQWDREACLASDALTGFRGDEETSLAFGDIQTIHRHSADSARVIMRNGREMVLSHTRAAGDGNRGVYVDDGRYGRVLVSWEAFQRIEFDHAHAASAPAYHDFPAGQPLRGTVLVRDGRQLGGRIVFDLDESETTQTLDAPLQGVHFTVPFGLIASIGPSVADHSGARHARVVLHGGEQLSLELVDDLGPDNAGLLVFEEGREDPEYLPWGAVDRIDFQPPTAMYPPLRISP